MVSNPNEILITEQHFIWNYTVLVYTATKENYFSSKNCQNYVHKSMCDNDISVKECKNHCLFLKRTSLLLTMA